ncbi:MAG: trypsin-like peptidase domain-containing protein [Burkholderiaceae bacterium]|nr:trypsin-like peptidase domain-containing protein [Burkholderiaceae bacterium]
MQIAKPSVQSLLIEMQFNGQRLATGTAFVVQTAAGPHLVTNRHNVTGRHQETGEPLSKTGGIPNEIVIVHNQRGNFGSWVRRVELLEANDSPRWIEHPTLGPRADLVALRLTALDDVELFPHDLGSPEPQFVVGPADPVSVVGFPFGLTAGGTFAVWATGFVASEPSVDYNDLPILLIDCRSRQGQSGSPVLAYRSGGAVATAPGVATIFDGPVQRLMGIYSGRVNAESDLGFVWKVSAIQELVGAL